MLSAGTRGALFGEISRQEFDRRIVDKNLVRKLEQDRTSLFLFRGLQAGQHLLEDLEDTVEPIVDAIDDGEAERF